ncbi:MAG: hypothetical protein K2O24_02745 [Muribaculaceae bacterium]|nr:hypothetical protein [Muribaculaceae bacterium]
MIRRLTRRYGRWRHTRGFGIHSPFAFSLIKDWLRPGSLYGMYGDAAIRETADRMDEEMGGRDRKRVIRRGRTLLRVLGALHPRTLWIAPGLPPTLRVAADAAGYRREGRMADDWRRASMLVLGGEDSLYGAELMRWLSLPGQRIILVFDAPEGIVERLYSTMPDGLMLLGRRGALLVRRKGMRKLRYTVNL